MIDHILSLYRRLLLYNLDLDNINGCHQAYAEVSGTKYFGHSHDITRTPVDTVEALQERIFQAIHEITPGMINNAIQHVRTRAEACLAANGGFEQLL
ncbi:hypothetical protein ABEB36_003246 [Hypothenemus hampei]|uniref:Uncharacterized protein n=1 Tax=Hypothenemus hampei TaxID=57062 RepID=A0ABD1FBP2_HYPHA